MIVMVLLLLLLLAGRTMLRVGVAVWRDIGTHVSVNLCVQLRQGNSKMRHCCKLIQYEVASSVLPVTAAIQTKDKEAFHTA